MLRKDRVFEILRAMCAEAAAAPEGTALRRKRGFSAEEVAERAAIDRTNASRDLNQLAQEGKVERIPGRPVLFAVRSLTPQPSPQPVGPEPSSARESQQKQTQQTQAPAATRQPDLPKLVRPEAPNKLPVVVASMQSGAIVTSFETLVGSDEGLKVAIQQAKAAMLYPPHGLHTLICGPSGVGKTTFARLMHAFAIEFGALPPNAPFISFNCADYAGNPQLLMAHLFGVVRGAYTGAERDRPGLVEQASGGILFLDEVHRLPPEGQEMLFYLMDRERFRRLGDVEERQASILLIAATTEDPSVTLLPTFRRRIPMLITLPGLAERSMQERYALIRAFFTTECSSIGANIHIEPQVIQALLLYECPGNIGQLRTDIQLLCARAYLDYRTRNLSELHVDVSILPDHVRRGLLRTAELQRSLEPLLDVLKVTHIFTPTGLSLDVLPHSARDLYETISQEVRSLRRSGLTDSEVNRLLQLEIQHYFQRFADEVTRARQEAAPHLVDEQVAAACRAVVDYAAQRLERDLPEKLALVLAMHVTSTLEHLARGHQVPASVIESVAETYPREYEVARAALAQLRNALQAPLPESEVDVLAVLLAHADSLLSSEQPGVGIVVAAHGRGIAAGLAELANTLVGVRTVRWVELSLEQSPDELVAQVASWVRVADQGAGVLLLVDFVSLLSLSELVEQQTGVRVRTVSDVSAPLVIEAVRRAQRSRDLSLDQLAESLTLNRAISSRSSSRERHTEPLPTGSSEGSSREAGRVILSVCLTGFGSAAKIAELINEALPGLHKQGIDILCMDMTLSYKTREDIQQLVGNRQVIAVVGTINPHLDDYPFIPLTDLLFGDGLARLRTLLGETLIDPALLQAGREQEPVMTTSLPLPLTSAVAAGYAPLGEALSDGNGTQAHQTQLFSRRADLVRQLTETLNQRMIFLNPTRVMPLLDRMIELIEVEVGESFPMEVLAGLMLHLACILERGVPYKGMLISDAVRRLVEQQFARDLSICRHALQLLGEQVGRFLPDEEAYNIVCILRQLDIFAARS
ncbi:sigma 54-interacting transcriptional regulator [Thermogemmatispora carboxidivorans]|uniref:sigma 54-interacting transcriptional regulator n=1 Tax=Thermogemmatispora carboxidivorans TaxID=1382306 RepID=UPI00069AD349|nr:sigma-54-dependent transcriptional regulator [Thermogemmatispora carboxidivorans]